VRERVRRRGAGERERERSRKRSRERDLDLSLYALPLGGDHLPRSLGSSLRRPPPPPPPPPRLDLPCDISTLTRVVPMRVPSKCRQASLASRGSSNSTKANPGGLRATHTFFSGPILEKGSSTSRSDARGSKSPTYTLQSRGHVRRDILSIFALVELIENNESHSRSVGSL